MVRRLALIIFSCLLPAVAGGGELSAIMVLNVRPQGKGLAETAGVLTDLVLQDMHDLKRFRVIGQKDVNQMLSIEQQKQLAGCSDTSCLVEIAGAMGTRYTIDGSLGAVGTASVLSLTLVDVSRAEVLAKKTAVVKGQREQLLSEVHKLMKELMEPVLNEVGEPRRSAATSAPVSRATPSARTEVSAPMHPYALWGHVSFWSGLGVAAIGGVMTGLASSANNDYKSGKDPSGAWDAVDRYNAFAVTGYSIGGALMATGVVLWILSPGDDARAKGQKISVKPVLGDRIGGLVLDGRW
ncbi:MAG: hypothetical protein HY897_05870 [Deltaproteobacteria bacterium]|nr:hypothetical protein [Deltaproteobacteria bacterium]